MNQFQAFKLGRFHSGKGKFAADAFDAQVFTCRQRQLVARAHRLAIVAGGFIRIADSGGLVVVSLRIPFHAVDGIGDAFHRGKLASVAVFGFKLPFFLAVCIRRQCFRFARYSCNFTVVAHFNGRVVGFDADAVFIDAYAFARLRFNAVFRGLDAV